MEQLLRIIVAGSRTFTDQETADREIREFVNEQKKKLDDGPVRVEFLSGACRGADSLGENYAERNCYTVKRFPADWGNWGNAAGPIRNAEMVRYACAADGQGLLALWDGKSAGTRNIISRAEEKGMRVKIVRVS